MIDVFIRFWDWQHVPDVHVPAELQGGPRPFPTPGPPFLSQSSRTGFAAHSWEFYARDWKFAIKMRLNIIFSELTSGPNRHAVKCRHHNDHETLT